MSKLAHFMVQANQIEDSEHRILEIAEIAALYAAIARIKASTHLSKRERNHRITQLYKAAGRS